MRYFTLLLCTLLVTACANKHQERAVIAGAILGGMIGAVSSQPNTNHAGNTSGNHGHTAPASQAEDEHMNEPKHHDAEEAKHENKQEYNDNSEDGNEGDDEHEKDD